MTWRFLAALLTLLLITLAPVISGEGDSDTMVEAGEKITDGKAASGNSTEGKRENNFADMIRLCQHPHHDLWSQRKKGF
jgi:hypothetical protein